LENLGEGVPRRVFRSRVLKRQVVDDILQPGASVLRVGRKDEVDASKDDRDRWDETAGSDAIA
jgi:hypothetical protein